MSDLTAMYSTLTSQERRTLRNAYVKNQNGMCFYCKRKLSYDPPEHIQQYRIHRFLFPEGFFNNPIHLHHDHDTDETEGAVHALCNAVLWEHEGR